VILQKLVLKKGLCFPGLQARFSDWQPGKHNPFFLPKSPDTPQKNHRTDLRRKLLDDPAWIISKKNAWCFQGLQARFSGWQP